MLVIAASMAYIYIYNGLLFYVLDIIIILFILVKGQRGERPLVAGQSYHTPFIGKESTGSHLAGSNPVFSCFCNFYFHHSAVHTQRLLSCFLEK